MTTLPRRAHVSWWMEEARADPALAASTTTGPLAGSARADVVVMGGGYTGMWTAWFLKEREPGLDIVLLEADELCGSGPSGRNGGFCSGLWEDLPALERRFGAVDALRVCDAAERSVGAIGDWLAAHDVDAWFSRPGHVTAASSPAQDGRWSELVALGRRLGVPDRFVELSAREVRARADLPVFRAGLLQPGGAVLQPARLALGLRRELMARGVRIHEGSPVVRFSAGPPVIAETPGGTVTAERGVLGLGAWTAQLPTYRRAIVPRGSYLLITEPAPDRLAAIGWIGGEGLADWRSALHYLRPTPDGRIAFGAAAATAGLRTGLGPRLRFDEASMVKLVDDFRRFFPSWEGVRIEAGWGGPIDVTPFQLPFFATLPGGSLHVGAGYTGGGVGPTHLGGRVLASLALGLDDGTTDLPLVHRAPGRFPPSPLLQVGAAVTQGAIVRRDEREDVGRRPGPVTAFLARLPRRMGYEIGP